MQTCAGFLRRISVLYLSLPSGVIVCPVRHSDFTRRCCQGPVAEAERTDCGGRAKYKDAIQACDDTAYIEFNVSQIARLFGLSPSALANQLRNHYPEILERREKERCRLGVNDNLHRGVKPWCREQYAEAVEHLRTSDDSIRETADLYALSYSGRLGTSLYYYKWS